MASRYILKVWQQARAGNAEAQVTLAEAYLRGQEGMGRNPAAARRWLETATRLGCPRAEDLLSQHFPNGKLPAPRPQGVRLLLPENCWRDAGGERWLNTLLGGQKPIRPDNWETRLAMQALTIHQAEWPGTKMPAEEKWQRACWLLLCAQPEASQWLEKAALAEAGQGQAACLLGLCLMGSELHPDIPRRHPVSYKKADYWLRRAAESEHQPSAAAASFALACLNRERNYRNRDPLAALRHLKRAARFGHPAALGLLAERGEATSGKMSGRRSAEPQVVSATA